MATVIAQTQEALLGPIMENGTIDFNFWPSFADTMLAFVLILALVIFVSAAGSVVPPEVRRNQEELARVIAMNLTDTTAKRVSTDIFAISLDSTFRNDIVIVNEPTLQKITFSNRILFGKDVYTMNESGRRILSVVGKALLTHLGVIREIQIQGHADTDSTRYASNVHLAAFRAIDVFKFLKDSVGIDPTEKLMSASSYGEFKPSRRSEKDFTYNRKRLMADNSTEDLKMLNRRIELLVFYAY